MNSSTKALQGATHLPLFENHGSTQHAHCLHFKGLLNLAATMFNVPVVVVNILEDGETWKTCAIGLTKDHINHHIFCDVVINQQDVLQLANIFDEARFNDAPPPV